MNAKSRAWLWVVAAAYISVGGTRADAQNRGLYPLGMTAINSGVTPESGFSYSNQLLYYSRDEAKDNNGNVLPIKGLNYVLMDMNSFVWVNTNKILGARYSAIATLPFAKNDLTSDIHGNVSGGAGFADSFYMPFVLGWTRKRVEVRFIYGFLAPTGRFATDSNSNVGSGYWTHTISSGQTFYPTKGKGLALSAFEMYEFHTTQEGTGVHPGETFDLDYSALASVIGTGAFRLQIGPAGYEARQTTAKTGPSVSAADSKDRYAINAFGLAVNIALPKKKASLGFKYFNEFADRSTFQGYSLQLVGAITF